MLTKVPRSMLELPEMLPPLRVVSLPMTVSPSFSTSRVFTAFNEPQTPPGGGFNHATGVYAPPASGWYLVTVIVKYSEYGGSTITAHTLTADIFKNGARYSFGTTHVEAGFPNAAITDLVYLNGSTDYVTAAARSMAVGDIPDVVATLSAVLVWPE